MALCSAIAATASKDLVESRGHKVEGIESFPIIVSDDIESISKASEMIQSIGFTESFSKILNRLQSRKPRTGKSSLKRKK